MVFFQFDRLSVLYSGNRIFLLFFVRGNTIRGRVIYRKYIFFSLSPQKSVCGLGLNGIRNLLLLTTDRLWSVAACVLC